MKLVAKQLAVYKNSLPAVLLTFTEHPADHRHFNFIKIRYELRAGRLGKGRLLARQECAWGDHPQRQAMDRIARKVEGFRLVEDEK